MESRPASGSASASRHVFGAGGPLSADELDSATRSFAELVLPLTTTWSLLLGRPVELAMAGVSPTPTPVVDDDPMNVGIGPGPAARMFEEIAGPNAYAAAARVSADLGAVAVTVPTALGLAMVDVLLGGGGRPAADRTLSAIDGDLLGTMMPATFATIRELAGSDDGEPVLLDDVEDTDLFGLLSGGVTLELTVTVAGRQHPVFVTVSAAGSRVLSGRSATHEVHSTNDESRRHMAAVLADVVVEAVVTFPPVSVPSRTILTLGVGDVVPLGTGVDRPLPLLVDGRHLADVRPARVGDEVACQVVATELGDTVPTDPIRPSAFGGLL